MSVGKDIRKNCEGLRLKAYADPGTGGAPWTIGYGHTKGVSRGDTCTGEQAEQWFEEDWAEAAAIVDAAVKVALSPQQRDALTSFVFNVGHGEKGVKDGLVVLKSGAPSTMLRLLNAGDYVGAAAQLPLWNKSGGRVLPGLTICRGKERALFLSGTNIPAPAIPTLPEAPMIPLAATILLNALPTLLGKLPEIAQIFKNPDVAERNVEAVSKVGQILIESTGATNMQDAVEKVQDDPEAAMAANEALRANRASLIDALETAWAADEKSVASARDAYFKDEQPVIGNWRFTQVLSLFLIVLGGSAAIAVLLGGTADATERAMALQTLLLVGFAGVVNFWLGSSRSSQVKDLLRGDQK